MNSVKILTTLQDKGFLAYFIGGCVRDMLMGLPSKDFDIVTSAKSEEVMDIFKDQKIKEVGRSFGVVLVDEVEVASFRCDKYFGLNDKNCEVNYATTLEEDVSRRDFTINQIAYNPITNEIIDIHNGQEDLKNKIIRFIDNPKDRIHEDPNRIIRACRFKAKIDGDFDDKTYEYLNEYSYYIEILIKPERIRLEILKAMSIKKASKFWTSLHAIGGLRYVLPHLDNAYLSPGGPYHIEDIYDHCMMAGDHISTKYPMHKLAGYLHDIGKPISSRINPDTNDIWFQGHDKTGSLAVIEDLTYLKFSNEEIKFVSNLVKNHMRISYERLSPKGIRKTLRILSEDGLTHKDLIRVAISDKMGGLKSQVHYKFRDVYNLAKQFRDEINRKPVSKFSDLEINGNEIMEVTGLNPGKEIGIILNWLMDLVLEDPELNEKEILISLIKEKWGRN